MGRGGESRVSRGASLPGLPDLGRARNLDVRRLGLGRQLWPGNFSENPRHEVGLLPTSRVNPLPRRGRVYGGVPGLTVWTPGRTAHSSGDLVLGILGPRTRRDPAPASGFCCRPSRLAPSPVSFQESDQTPPVIPKDLLHQGLNIDLRSTGTKGSCKSGRERRTSEERPVEGQTCRGRGAGNGPLNKGVQRTLSSSTSPTPAPTRHISLLYIRREVKPGKREVPEER